MTDLEIGIVHFINAYHKENTYRYENYQLLHGVKYRKEMSLDNLKLIREGYDDNSFEAAYELKTYYMENHIPSNTIVLKMRPKTPDQKEIEFIKIYSEKDNAECEYILHTIEIFKEHGKYKVLDILHSDKAVWLENYLDEVCKTNNCTIEQLRYDMGYLAPCHAFAENMQELSDVMRYLDKKCCIGKPRLNLVNTHGTGGSYDPLSDDMAMDFDAFGRMFGVSGEEVVKVYQKNYDRMMAIRFNMLHVLCMGRIMRDPIMSFKIAETLFDDAEICQMMDETSGKEIF